MRSLLSLLVLSGCLPPLEEKSDGCPAIAVSPTSVAWTDVRVGSSGTATVTLTNDCDGEGTLDVSGLTLTGDASFSVGADLPAPLAPGASADVLLTYTPDDGAADAGTLSIASNAGSVDVALSGSPVADADGDGFYADEDCDDANPDASPGEEEVWYDGVDGDCSGGSDYDQDGDGHDADAHGGDDCDDLDAGVSPDAAEQWYDDVDQDCSGGSDHDQDGDGQDTLAAGGTDCDDTRADVYQDAPEAWYDGVDQDCRGGDDFDQDRDGHASDAHGGDDCDDEAAAVYPGAAEVWYDGVDQDCAGDDDYDQDVDGDPSDAHGGGDCQDQVDGISSLETETWYDGIDQDCAGDDDHDQDHDGVARGADCDDEDATVYPGAADTWYDGVDQDCAGNDDYDQDGDGDPSTAYGGGDCADTIPSISSLATETWYDGIDQDCAGDDDYDQDGDGGRALASGGDDCDDLDPDAYLGAAETWYDGVDQDCLGGDDYDQDGDGYQAYPWGADCDDLDPTALAGTAEARNGVDDDCDGLVDEGVSAFGDLVVTEIMLNPSRVADTVGEWVEIYNPGTWDVDLDGWRMGATDGNSVTIGSSVVVPPGGFVVLGLDRDPSRNGGVTVDYAYLSSSFSLTDSGDSVMLYAPEGTLVASVTYASRTWDLVSGASLSLDPYFADATSAGSPEYWCASNSTYGSGDRGTPGDENDVCGSIDHDGDGETLTEGDCDDFDPGVSSSAAEVTDGVDQDCDGMVDEITAPVAGEPYLDGTASYWNLYVNGFADAEGDGVVDLFYVSLNNDYLYTAPMTSWASWAGSHTSYGSQEIPSLVTSFGAGVTYTESVVDLTGDLDADYVIGGYTPAAGGTLHLFRGPAAGHSSGGDYDMTIGGSSPGGTQPVPHVGGDFNGDGTSELVVAGEGSTWSGRTAAGYVGIYDLVGAPSSVGRDDADQLYYGAAADQYVGDDVAIADWNGDGYADLAVTGTESVWLVTGDGLSASGSASISAEADATIGWSGADTVQIALLDDVGDGGRSLVAAADSLRRWADVGSLSGTLSADAADNIVESGAGWAPTLGTDPADVDGDGVDDLLFSANGAGLTLLHGYSATDWPVGSATVGAGALLWEIGETGAVWGPAYDLDGDGTDEVVLSHLRYSSTGRTWFVSF